MTEALTYQNMTDEELVSAAKAGDIEAMNQLFANYKSIVTRISRRYCLFGSAMEDIVQEGMIALYKAVQSFSCSKSNSFKPFAIMCIKHGIFSAIKIASSQKNMVLSSALPIVSEDDEENGILDIFLASDLPLPDEHLLEDERAYELKAKIEKYLSPLESKVLALYLQGYSYHEISQRCDISKKSVGNALTRIKNKLQFIKKEF